MTTHKQTFVFTTKRGHTHNRHTTRHLVLVNDKAYSPKQISIGSGIVWHGLKVKFLAFMQERIAAREAKQ